MKANRMVIAAALVLAGATLVSGCSATRVTPGGSETVRVIQTYGEAEIMAEPDLAKISLAVQTRGPSAVDVAEENAALANSVWEALLDYGLDEDDLKTGSYNLYTYREWLEPMPTREEEQITYQAVNEIIVSTTNLDTVGEVIDLAIRSGVNNVNYINFELENPQELLMQALAAASEQASNKAEAIADSTGSSISALHTIREERADYIPFRAMDNMYKEEAAMGAAPTPISPDRVTVRAAVVAEFAIR